MARMFGTDGVRGIANTELTNQIAYRLGQATVSFLGSVIVVGKDTRLSGDMLECSLIAGITSAGGTALRAGVVPTPAVAILVKNLCAAGGVVISASHNPPEYNGIKLFDASGFKLPDNVEDEIEKFVLQGGLEGSDSELPSGSHLGRVIDIEDASEMYIQHAVSSVQEEGISFEEFVVALDAGHGASSYTSPQALERLGATVHVINDDYDGLDINVQCGSTCLDPLKTFMQECGAHIGIAHDGDADRVMMVSPSGQEIDGDIIEAVCAIDMKQRGCLSNNTAVTTVMCNLGFIEAMNNEGIHVVQTQVGDRYVLEEMRTNGYSIGGEQSGHMILLDYNSTGDGLVTALQFLAAIKRSQKSVDEAISIISKFPQVLINVKVEDKEYALSHHLVQSAIAQAEESLGSDGRILLRPSGTEPVVRVMVEAKCENVANEIAENIANTISNITN